MNSLIFLGIYLLGVIVNLLMYKFALSDKAKDSDGGAFFLGFSTLSWVFTVHIIAALICMIIYYFAVGPDDEPIEKKPSRKINNDMINYDNVNSDVPYWVSGINYPTAISDFDEIDKKDKK